MDGDQEQWFDQLSTGQGLSFDNFKTKLSWTGHYTDKDGNTTLHWLVRKGWKDNKTGQEYFDVWWDDNSYNEDLINKQNNDGDTALNWAVMKGNLPKIKRLTYKTKKDLTNKDGNTPLHLTAIYGWNCDAVAEELINEKFPLYTKNNKGQTVLDVAKQHKRDALVTLLSFYFPDGTELEKLYTLMDTKPPFTKDTVDRWLEMLFQFGPNAKIQDKQYGNKQQPLGFIVINYHNAAADPDYVVIKKLLDKNPDFSFLDSDNKNNYLHSASSNPQSPLTIDLLFDHLKKTQPNKIPDLINAKNMFQYSPILLAANKANKQAVLRLLAEGADTTVESIYINPSLDDEARQLLNKPQAEAQAAAKKLLGIAPEEKKAAESTEAPKAEEPKEDEPTEPEEEEGDSDEPAEVASESGEESDEDEPSPGPKKGSSASAASAKSSGFGGFDDETPEEKAAREKEEKAKAAAIKKVLEDKNLKTKVDINENVEDTHTTPLVIVAREGSEELFNTVLENKHLDLAINNQGLRALEEVFRRGFEVSVQLLLSKLKQKNLLTTGYGPKILQMMLSAAFDKYRKTTEKPKLLKMITMLVDAGADVNATNKESTAGEIPLYPWLVLLEMETSDEDLEKILIPKIDPKTVEIVVQGVKKLKDVPEEVLKRLLAIQAKVVPVASPVDPLIKKLTECRARLDVLKDGLTAIK